jgi:hypothetical protein
VFLETPITLAIVKIGIRSARRSRRISAQSSTPNTPLPPQLDTEPGSSRVVSFRPSGGGQFSCAVDKYERHRRTAREIAEIYFGASQTAESILPATLT